MHEDVPLENKIITTVDQLPSCPRKTTHKIPQPLSKVWIPNLQDKPFLGSQCPELKLLNGQTQCTDENYYKSECRFVCNEGFVLDGTTSTTCRGVAKPDWDTKKPACSKLSFRESPSFENISILQSNKNYFRTQNIIIITIHWIGEITYTCCKYN